VVACMEAEGDAAIIFGLGKSPSPRACNEGAAGPTASRSPGPQSLFRSAGSPFAAAIQALSQEYRARAKAFHAWEHVAVPSRLRETRRLHTRRDGGARGGQWETKRGREAKLRRLSRTWAKDTGKRAAPWGSAESITWPIQFRAARRGHRDAPGLPCRLAGRWSMFRFTASLQALLGIDARGVSTHHHELPYPTGERRARSQWIAGRTIGSAFVASTFVATQAGLNHLCKGFLQWADTRPIGQKLERFAKALHMPPSRPWQPPK
jgi:hypothetical protein